MRPQPGDLINGKYRLVRLIGDGGMGTVFEARHEYLGTSVALKFLHAELARRPGLVQRFLREARLSASIQSPHIAHVTDVDQASDGVAYIVMELLEGRSLTSLLEKGKKLSLDTALDYTLQMLAGLEAAHAAGVVHRDLKPDNVFVVTTTRGPLVKLLDFGIAKLRTSKEFQVALTRPGVMMGTPEYMAPEQVYSADSVDARADVYSVGAMLYEMLAGTRPAQGDDAQQIATYIVAGKVVRLDQLNPAVSAGLADVVHRAMSPSPAERIASVTDLRDALLPYCGSLSFAGRLAATPAPSSGGVAPTWPPDEGPTKPAATQAAGSTEARPQGLPPTANASAWQPTPPGASPSPGPAHGYGAPGYAFQPPVHVAPMPTSPTRARSPRRLSVWLFLVMIAVAIGIVVMAVAMGQPSERREPERTSAVAPEPPRVPTATTTAVAAAPRAPTAGIASPLQPPVQPPKEQTPAANRPPLKRASDAGAEDAAPSIGLPGLPLPFPLPSALPLPSAFPLPLPIPSGFPPFGLPGFPQQTAPAQSAGSPAPPSN
jgi:serine/threonine-protein kinase